MVTVLRIRLEQVTDHRADLVRIGPRRSHAILSSPHFARSNHLHGFRDLLRVRNAPDLSANFFEVRHRIINRRRYA